MENYSFTWVQFYSEFADKLLLYQNNRQALIQILKDEYDKLNLHNHFIQKDGPLNDIGPFTVFGCFNRGLTDENRIALMKSIGLKIGVETDAPSDLKGVPILNNMRTLFYSLKSENIEESIDNLWQLFETAINFADEPSETNRVNFKNFFDIVRKQSGIRWNITMGLYWIRPYSYLNLDKTNRDYLIDTKNIFGKQIAGISDLKLPNSEEYLEIIDKCKYLFEKEDSVVKSFPELSYNAWIKKDPREGSSTIDPTPQTEVRYWLYSPGRQAKKWNEFYQNGIMGIRRGEIGDLRQYSSKTSMKNKMKEFYGEEFSYRNAAHATWQFTNEMKPGDIIYAKQGQSKVIGRGVVQSEYIFDNSRDEYKNIRKVNWTHKGEWPHPGKAVTKMLTDITPYTAYCKKLKALFFDDAEEELQNEVELTYPEYTEDDFLEDVFMDSERYHTLVALVKSKKNIILQGAPGVGKTFVSKRLACSIMGTWDPNRVMMVQFHQSYSYEDFIMGYRPTENGFELNHGPFYEFCKQAQEDDENDYFFIIDEINRGNLSKIFGELMMLIENDKRGEKLRIIYSDELFSVPPNVHIIGLMNTADRSLAMIDYALRRRFAFFNIEPAFDSEGFQTMVTSSNNSRFSKLIEQVKLLNEFIAQDESLGEGFKVGHSFFCLEGNVSNDILSSIIEYEIVPLLEEYWFDEKDKIEQWKKTLYGSIK
ncbi:AAA family ATPase [Methanohalophilus portucalensis]|uniref:5-methylcytosine-specific restriction enzyme B n=2 Tax=Methanohalophilus portucalensis TaxID=39664 RepID=A0A1L9C2Q8_9EURY|nr:AAA family ATPase [Methanohalophilus portucalensis]ATU07676.1 AAA family ATPase [Methanohalophilus portucalensis]OJH48822.1 ATPase [Methanohalophilus portucalensis FDF-1]RNI08798.1 AAA family ATPase [Methanohalophilus portucalensis FDF-1]SMH36785.1 5-methylcytosine-specific restriction enzyme B [Methanohalophilus portucalensis FDF-1]